MPITPIHNTVPTSASAALPPFFSREMPIFEHTALSEATAPRVSFSSCVGRDDANCGKTRALRESVTRLRVRRDKYMISERYGSSTKSLTWKSDKRRTRKRTAHGKTS